jgi:hypothetical protein
MPSPKKLKKKKNRLSNKFYRHFTDLMMETVKLHT